MIAPVNTKSEICYTGQDMKNWQNVITGILSADKDVREAFLSGFARGLSCSVSLYAHPVVPAPAKTTIQPIRRAAENPVEAIRSDWVSVGSDIDAAVRKYAEAR